MSKRSAERAAPSGSGRRIWLVIAGCALLLAAFAAAWRYTPLSELITAEHIRGWAKAARGASWTPYALVLAYTPAAFVMLPRQVLTLFAVIAFGPWQGFAYAITGIILCGIAAYYVGLAIPPKTLDRLMRGKLERFKKPIKKHGVIAVLTLRILPTAPYVVESMACGALRITFWEYVAGTLLGMVPGVLATTVFGQQVAAALEDSSKMNYWIAGGAVVAFIAVMYVMRRVLSD